MAKKVKSTKKPKPVKKVKSISKPKPLTREIIRKYIDSVEHFFIPSKGGWPIWCDKNDQQIVEYFPQLKFDRKGMLYRDKSVSVPSELFQLLLEDKIAEIVEEFINAVKQEGV